MTWLLLLAFQLGVETPLADAQEEARAQGLMREIRCVVCENEPVSQSTADIAVDMRRAIRKQVEAGKSNNEIRHFFTDKYGQFASFRPPTEGFWLLLWAFPFLLVGGAAAFLGMRAFGKRKPGLKPLPDDGRGPLEG
ncbi:MAG: cytochrome c-type biogenesis protein CcmH [Hyphomonadaceae bacterium]|nr:cytochrome c-type biogenesis protein CcmH [Hyphomonadaceae bacterium]